MRWERARPLVLAVLMHSAWITALGLSLSVPGTDPALCASADDPNANGLHGPFSYVGHPNISGAIDVFAVMTPLLVLIQVTFAFALWRKARAPIGWSIANGAVALAGLVATGVAFVAQTDGPIWCANRTLSLR